jgi:hypothetical protein
MSRRLAVPTLLVSFALGFSTIAATSAAQAPPASAGVQDGPGLETKAVDPESIPWPMLLGARVAALEQRLPVVETVVLVPDEATFLAEIARWSPRGRWPVLFEDDRYAPLFVKRFAPRRVFRRTSVGTLPADPASTREQALASVIRALGGDPARQTLQQLFEASGFLPPGIVLTDFRDPAWPAAVALAAGRGQVLEVLEGDFGTVSQSLDPTEFERVDRKVRAALDRCGFEWGGVRDAIEAITICRALPVKAEGALPQGRRVEIAVQGLDTNLDLATSDLLGRTEGGERFAIVGQIFGDRVRSTYAAMCSLFLPRERIELFNTYGREGDWGVYGMTELEPILEGIGFEVETAEGAAAGPPGWLAFGAGTPPDVLVLNSSGEPDRMSLAGGASAQASEIPRLRAPLALHMIHSFSLARPDDLGTLGGAWLEAGAYAYVGAVSEPYLASFIPPRFLLERVVNRTPFLAASRQYEGPFVRPWRVMTYGDPLMLVLPPNAQRLPRIPPPGSELVPGELLRDSVKEPMRAAAAGDVDAAAEAMRELRLLGESAIAARLWAAIRGRPGAARMAPEALVVLFEQDDFRGFLQAWEMVPNHDPSQVEMLWQLVGPRLGALSEPAILTTLQASLRGPRRWIDLERLLPHLSRVLGPGIARRIVQRELDETTDASSKRELQRILASLGSAGLDGGVDAAPPTR